MIKFVFQKELPTGVRDEVWKQGLEAKDGARGYCSGSEKIKTHHIKLGARRVGGMGVRSSWEAGWTALGDRLDRHKEGRAEEDNWISGWDYRGEGSTPCWWKEPKEIRFKDWAEEGNSVLNIMSEKWLLWNIWRENEKEGREKGRDGARREMWIYLYN